MVLLVGGAPLDASGPLLDQALASPELQAACSAFLESVCSLHPRAPSLHVFQSELACGVPLGGAAVRYLGSTDATTCVIAVLIDPPSGTAAAAHFDSASAASVASVGALLRGMAAPLLFLAGGYCDARGQGPRDAEALLHRFHTTQLPISLRLCACGRANTDAAGAPRCQALALDLATLAPYPAHFADRGPLPLPRLAQLWLRDDPSAMQQIYGSPSNRLVLHLYGGGVNQELLRYLEYILRQEPRRLVELVSTSPEHEGPGFVEDMRGSLAWLVQQEGPRRLATYAFEWRGRALGWQEARAEAAAGGSGAAPALNAAAAQAVGCT